MLSVPALDKQTLDLIMILFVSLVAWAILQLFIKRLIDAITTGTPRGRRLRTLSNVVRTIIGVLIVAFTIFESLSVLGVNLAPLIAAAGVSGLAIGFGSQALVKDVISGFFLLAEDQFDEGDEISISDKKGIVKKISLRTVWLEDSDGTIHIVPNGIITVVSNFSRKNVPDRPAKKLDKK